MLNNDKLDEWDRAHFFHPSTHLSDFARAMPEGDIIGFPPPLCLTRQEAEQIVTATLDPVSAVCG